MQSGNCFWGDFGKHRWQVAVRCDCGLGTEREDLASFDLDVEVKSKVWTRRPFRSIVLGNFCMAAIVGGQSLPLSDSNHSAIAIRGEDSGPFSSAVTVEDPN